MSDTIPTPESEPKAEKFWEVSFSIVTRKDCTAIVRAETKAKAEAIVESLSSDAIEYGIDTRDEGNYHQTPTCDYEEETVEDATAYGPLYEDDL